MLKSIENVYTITSLYLSTKQRALVQNILIHRSHVETNTQGHIQKLACIGAKHFNTPFTRRNQYTGPYLETSHAEQTLLSAWQSLSTSIINWQKNYCHAVEFLKKGRNGMKDPTPTSPIMKSYKNNPAYQLAPNILMCLPSHMDDIKATLDVYKFFSHHALNLPVNFLLFP